jgi:tetratricopeptide (TPR) repeat protein
MKSTITPRSLFSRRTRIFVPLMLAPLLQAVFAAAAAAQVNAEAVSNHLRNGEAALAENRRDEAEREFRAALGLDPHNTQAHADLGTLEWMRGDCPASRQDLRAAFAASPSLIKVEGLLGICEKRLGDAAAETHLHAAFTQLKDAKLRMEVGVELGDLYYQRGDFDNAVPVVRELVALNPENTDILFFAQHVYQEMADETMNKLALIAPGSARMQQVIAEHLVNAGDLKGAAEHYRQALQIDPSLPGAHFELAEAIVEAAPHDGDAQTEGRKDLEAALKLDGESARIECELGRVADLQGEQNIALAHYQRAYALNPKEEEAQMGISRILLSQEKPQLALRYLKEAVDQDPLNAEAHYHYARALKALHRDEEAKSEMDLFETVRRAQATVRDLYRQMNKRPELRDDQLPAAEASEP